ncbi:MAG: polyphosphate kinase 2 family protein [Nitrososphaeraceae archaeon]|nr:polyphosphate kinase 2 family protein [Nitrososphaeraceae archaeon]
MKSIQRSLVIKPGKTAGKLKLKDWDPMYDAGKKREDAEIELLHFSRKISKLQYKLFAASSQSLIIILQGVDTSGKDGTIRHVMGALNPQSCYVKPFRVPTTEDLSHDYLWRIHIAVPSKGQIAIFNRSHYEDIIEVRVRNLVPKNKVMLRYRQINDFERYLSENNITILKFFLYISKDEQKKRLQERIEDRTKYWKISEGDFEDRKYWDKYMEYYEEALNKCSTKWAPWYIIPANLKWFRNWAVAQIITETLNNMKLKHPQPKIDVSKLVIV